MTTATQAEGDPVERAVAALAGDVPGGGAAISSRGGETGQADDFDILAASEWPGIPEADVLLSPAQCRALWRQFASDCSFAVQQVCWSPNYSHNYWLPRALRVV